MRAFSIIFPLQSSTPISTLTRRIPMKKRRRPRMEAISRRPGTRSRSHTQMFFSLSPYFRSLHPEHEPANSEKGILVLGPRERDPGIPSAGQLGKLRSRARTLSLQRQLRRGRVLPSGPPPPALHPPTHTGVLSSSSLPSPSRHLRSREPWFRLWRRRGCSCGPRPVRNPSRTFTTSRWSTSGAS